MQLRVFVSDMDVHKIFVLKLTHSERWQEKRREAMEEARARRALRGEQRASASGEDERGDATRRVVEATRQAERTEKENRRDRAVLAILRGRDVHSMLGLQGRPSEMELRHAVRLAMRLLHPDAAINIVLKGTPAGDRIEAAFKRMNNLKDMRIEQWFTGEIFAQK